MFATVISNNRFMKWSLWKRKKLSTWEKSINHYSYFEIWKKKVCLPSLGSYIFALVGRYSLTDLVERSCGILVFILFHLSPDFGFEGKLSKVHLVFSVQGLDILFNFKILSLVCSFWSDLCFRKYNSLYAQQWHFRPTVY